MSVMKYKDPTTGEVKKVGAPKADMYTKGETDTLLQNKADKSIPELLTLPLPDGYIGSITYRKNQFGMVTVYIDNVRLESGDKLPVSIAFATLPEGYRPSIEIKSISLTSWWTDGNINTWVGNIDISKNGTISFYSFSGSSTVRSSCCIVSFYI